MAPSLQAPDSSQLQRLDTVGSHHDQVIRQADAAHTTCEDPKIIGSQALQTHEEVRIRLRAAGQRKLEEFRRRKTHISPCNGPRHTPDVMPQQSTAADCSASRCPTTAPPLPPPSDAAACTRCASGDPAGTSANTSVSTAYAAHPEDSRRRTADVSSHTAACSTSSILQADHALLQSLSRAVSGAGGSSRSSSTSASGIEQQLSHQQRSFQDPHTPPLHVQQQQLQRVDPLVDMLLRQVESLMAEKSALSQDGDALHRENEQLRELVGYLCVQVEELEGRQGHGSDGWRDGAVVGGQATWVASCETAAAGTCGGACLCERCGGAAAGGGADDGGYVLVDDDF